MNPMPSMEALVKILESEGVEVVFGVPGAAINPLYKALAKSSIRHITVRHEEGGTHAADGYARATGKVGVCIGTSGPAGTNMVTGLYTAMADSIPILTITGQVPTRELHREAFQAVDIAEIVRPVVKRSFLVREAAQLPGILREAFRIMKDGRPGPVHIDLPLDVQLQEIPYDPDVDTPLPISKPSPNPKAVAKALTMLLEAERPLILAGGGIILGEAWEELRSLAEYLQIPVAFTLMGWGALPDEHPLVAGRVGIQTFTPAGNQAFLEADLVLAVGARFAERHTGDLAVYRQGRRFIHVDIEPTQIGRIFPPELGIVADSKLFLKDLLALAQDTLAQRETTAWVKRVQHLKSTLRWRTHLEDVPIKPARVYQEINAAFDPEGTIFTTAIGLYQIWSGQFQHVSRPRQYLVCGQAGPLGWEVPAAIGAKLAKPEKTVVAVCGDYSFQFTMEEVAVAVQYRIPLVIVVVNNGNLGLIRQNQKYVHGFEAHIDLAYDHNLGYGLDHVKAVEAMGGQGIRVTRPEDIRPALEWARKTADRSHLPTLVEILIDREADASMGPALDKIRLFTPLEVGLEEVAV